MFAFCLGLLSQNMVFSRFMWQQCIILFLGWMVFYSMTISHFLPTHPLIDIWVVSILLIVSLSLLPSLFFFNFFFFSFHFFLIHFILRRRKKLKQNFQTCHLGGNSVTYIMYCHLQIIAYSFWKSFIKIYYLYKDMHK